MYHAYYIAMDTLSTHTYSCKDWPGPINSFHNTAGQYIVRYNLMPSPWLRGIYLLEIIFSLQDSSIPRSTFSNTTDQISVKIKKWDQYAKKIQNNKPYICTYLWSSYAIQIFTRIFWNHFPQSFFLQRWTKNTCRMVGTGEGYRIYHTHDMCSFIFFPSVFKALQRLRFDDLVPWFIRWSVSRRCLRISPNKSLDPTKLGKIWQES